jgi:hypothetical protein
MGPTWSSVYSPSKTPVYGTRPYVGLSPYAPENDAGILIEPAWSPPIAMSHSPVTTSTAEPLEEPPAVRVGSWGLGTGPVSEVWLPSDTPRCSHVALPTILPPASRIRVTMVASTSGTNPSSSEHPFIIGTPATQTLSFRATDLPASGPSCAPSIAQRQYHALSGFSPSEGR